MRDPDVIWKNPGPTLKKVGPYLHPGAKVGPGTDPGPFFGPGI